MCRADTPVRCIDLVLAGQNKGKIKINTNSGGQKCPPYTNMTSQMTSQYNEDSAGGTFWLHGKYRTRRRVLVNSWMRRSRKVRRSSRAGELRPPFWCRSRNGRGSKKLPGRPEGVVARSEPRCDDSPLREASCAASRGGVE